jgi:hypothetical protein
MNIRALFFWFWGVSLVITIFPIPSFSENAFENVYHVRLETNRKIVTYEIKAPEDYFALDSVLISGIYNKNIGKVLRVVVEETGLSTENIPAETFYVKIEDRPAYKLVLNAINPLYVMTAIQATKYFLSKSEVEEIRNPSSPLALYQMPPHQHTIKTPWGETLNYQLNSIDDDKAQMALEIAAQLAKNQSRISLYYKKELLCSKLFMGI